MNQEIKKMLEQGILIGGMITRTDEHFITFERINDLAILESMELHGAEIGLATTSMGRAIFQITNEGKIENYKGVNSGLAETENAVTIQTGANVAKIENPQYPGHHQIFLKSTPGQNGKRKYEVRFMGTAPLEDLEIEADINAKMRKFGIKLPRIKSVREFPNKVAEEWGLPLTVEGDYRKFSEDSNYSEEDKARKENLKALGIEYAEALPEGERPELLREYFERLGLMQEEGFEEFLQKERELAGNPNLELKDFIDTVDKQYSLGQRYGQATRILESPFRISDIEKFVEEKNEEAVQAMMDFSQKTIPACQNREIERVFAGQMGTNLALLLNHGWMLENMAHRQDYSLAGEMCDDSYVDMKQKFQDLAKEQDAGKANALAEEYKRRFFAQIHFLASTVKVMQEEMRLREEEEARVALVLEQFVGQFVDSLNFNEMANTIGKSVSEITNLFFSYLNTNGNFTYDTQHLPAGYTTDGKRDYVLEMAATNRREGILYDDAILLANKGNQEFYRMVSESIKDRLQIKAQMKGAELHMEDLLKQAIGENHASLSEVRQAIEARGRTAKKKKTEEGEKVHVNCI